MLFSSFAPLRLGVRFSSVYSLRLGVRSFGLSRGEGDLIGHDQQTNAIPPSRSAVSGS
jgi:hypothetical protein